ncbi:hypothetical protein [Pseudidiomarina donghaiensis]|uniref:hypothetical protein n=1 Tax=Pseudidiomarina donghaiensis TaxID=519452 RepID=UPI003A979201
MLRMLVFPIMFLLAGCASIPLTTMLQFSGFDANAFQNINPSELRAKISIDEPANVKAESVDLNLALNDNKGIRTFTLPLALLEQNKISADTGLFFSSPAKTEYVFKLASSSIESFQEVQGIIAANSGGSFKLSVGSEFEPLPESVNEITVSILLKLTEQSDYVTLVDEATLTFERDN